jgi:chromosome segregation ATPase
MILTDEQVKSVEESCKMHSALKRSHLDANDRIKALKSGIRNAVENQIQSDTQSEFYNNRADRLAVVADALASEIEEKHPFFSATDTTFPVETIAIMVQQGFQIAASLSRQIRDGESAVEFVKRLLSERDRAEARVEELESINRGLLATLEGCGERLRELVDATQRLINKVNRVTSAHRHGIVINKSDLDALSNRQIETEKALAAANGE